MKIVATIILLIFAYFGHIGCDVSSGRSISKDSPKIEKFLVLKTQVALSSERAVSFNFDFIEDRRLWNTVNWGTMDAQFSFSDDLGETWTAVKVPESFGADSTITFVDGKHGWAVSGKKIVRTTDGGKSWEKLSLPVDSEITEIKGITFSDTEHGFLTGSTGRRERGSGKETLGMEILCTNDGGEHWSICFQTSEYDLIQKIVSTKDFVIGLLWETAILKSINRGQTWERCNVDFKVRDIEFDFSGKIWSLDDGSGLRFSEDYGKIWQEREIVNANQDIHWNSIAFSKDGIGIVVGDQGKIGVSVNNGASWALYPKVIPDEKLLTVRIQSSNIAILGERNLYILELKK